jgi:hypothetical protein
MIDEPTPFTSTAEWEEFLESMADRDWLHHLISISSPKNLPVFRAGDGSRPQHVANYWRGCWTGAVG